MNAERLLDFSGPLSKADLSDPKAIASALADHIREVAAEDAENKAAYDAWLKANGNIKSDYKPSPFSAGNPEAVREETKAIDAKHANIIQDKLEANKALIDSISQAVLTAGVAYISGGIAFPALVESLLDVGIKIKEALDA